MVGGSNAMGSYKVNEVGGDEDGSGKVMSGDLIRQLRWWWA